jgi:hypothetical protein
MAHTKVTAKTRPKSTILLKVDMRNSDSLYVHMFIGNDMLVNNE